MKKLSIYSPLPGVFYRKGSPDEEVFVKEGQHVKIDETICVIEVMKMYYEVKTQQDGILVQFNLNSGDIVEAGQEIALLEINKNKQG